MTLRQAMKRIEELEKRVKELETRPAEKVVERHKYHYHYNNPLQQPLSPVSPWYSPTIWCNGNIGAKS